MTKNKDTMPNSTEWIEIILDKHATEYAVSTKRFITGEYNEEMRNSKWNRSDQEAKHQILTAIKKKMPKERQLDGVEYQNTYEVGIYNQALKDFLQSLGIEEEK